ncbi:MAG: hypothetical protein G01um101466_578 [Parcubacteria group bacterium Gr01-1014_66]|nr:MAG: hypothetical protein G01um101466_578 [Parcubacteria group bacterium Gr01-1014_66]
MTTLGKLLVTLLVLIVAAGAWIVFKNNSQELSPNGETTLDSVENRGATVTEQRQMQDSPPAPTGDVDAAVDVFVQDAMRENASVTNELNEDSTAVSSENETLIEFGHAYDTGDF